MSTVPTPQTTTTSTTTATTTATSVGTTLWQECVLRFPVVTTRWSRVHELLKSVQPSIADGSSSRVECSVLLHAWREENGAATVATLLAFDGVAGAPEAIELARHAVAMESSVDDFGVLHLDFRREGASSPVLSISVDCNENGRLHFARTSLLAEVDVPAGGYEQPIVDRICCNAST